MYKFTFIKFGRLPNYKKTQLREMFHQVKKVVKEILRQ